MLANTKIQNLWYLLCGKSKRLVILSLYMGITAFRLIPSSPGLSGTLGCIIFKLLFLKLELNMIETLLFVVM